jgi:hypothetical protein
MFKSFCLRGGCGGVRARNVARVTLPPCNARSLNNVVVICR